MATDKSALALVMTYRKMLAEKEEEILTLKKQYPRLLNLEEITRLKESFRTKRSEYDEITDKIEKINNQLNKLSKTRTVNQEEERLFLSLKDLKNKYEATKDDLNQLMETLEITSTVEGQKYIQALEDRNYFQKQLSSLEQTLDHKSLEQISNLQATEKRLSPFGPVQITKNLLDGIQKSTDWQKEFSNKYKLEFKEHTTDKKLEFVSQERDIQIEVTQEKISGQWSKEKDQTAIPMMVELYLKAIENQKVDKHKVEGKNPEVTKLIEVELANQLKTKGLELGEINNKKIDDILNSKSNKLSQPI